VESELTHAKLFFLASDLGAGDAVAQLALLACGLPRDRFAVTVGTLCRADTPAADALRRAGLSVMSLPIRHPLNFSGMRKLRSAVRAANPAVLHCFGPAAVRAARLATSGDGHGGNVPRVVASAATSCGGGVGGWLSGRQLRRADRVLATGRAEGERYRRLGVRGERLTLINPAVAPPGEAPDRAAFCHDIAAPADSKLIFAGGSLNAAHGIKEAVIAFDMLRYASPSLQLVLTGAGPHRVEAEELGRALAFDDFRIRFTGARSDLPVAVRLAEMVWVTCERGGESLALSAMAAGKPVIAYRTPELGEVIDDGTTGYLVPPGDRAALSARAHELLSNPELAARMGEAGRARAAERFGVARMVEQHTRVYQELVG
jgi:glycosyltransferase involved in cell wall biosynthesis